LDTIGAIMSEIEQENPARGTAAAVGGAVVAAAVGTAIVRRARKASAAKSGKEIERKWVLASEPPLESRACDEIRQGYVFTGVTEMRVRSMGSRYFLTIKANAGDARDEWESEIPQWAFDAVWPSTKGCRLRKRRYSWREGRQTMEVDVYAGKLKGLIVLETEFRSARAARHFAPPEWAAGAREVTGDRAFSNQSLARNGLTKIRRHLK
jgi:CYTH domain-containing protein